jgi:hypothetical protein
MGLPAGARSAAPGRPRPERKKVQRLWREEGLRMSARRRKRQRLGDSRLAVGAIQRLSFGLRNFENYDRPLRRRAVITS